MSNAFADLFNFENVAFLKAFRHYLSTFMLPKEGQCIDQVVHSFASKYYKDNQNAGIFNSADACYVFSYSVVILQTELYNPNLAYRERMDAKGFMRNNEGI